MSGGGGGVSSSNEFTQQQAAIAEDQFGTYKELYKPLERTAVNTLNDMNTAGAYERASSSAVADVAKSFDTQRGTLSRMREGAGMFSSLDDLDSLKLSIGEATARALASNRGRQGQYGNYLASLQGAVNTGRNVQSSAGDSFGRLGSQRLQTDQANAQAEAQSDSETGAMVGTLAMAAMMMM